MPAWPQAPARSPAEIPSAVLFYCEQLGLVALFGCVVVGGLKMGMIVTEKKPYVRPVLARREKLNEVTAVTLASGKTVD